LYYFSIKLENNTWSTPFEIAQQVKPDLRVLFILFGLAAAEDSHLGKFESQSVPMIAVG
jgi:hypothetical protein